MKIEPPQTNFTGGEVSPILLGRADLKKYGDAVQGLTNVVVRQQGGLFKRTGTSDQGGIKDTTKTFRLIDFNPTVDSPYQIELGDYTLRVRKLGALVSLTTPTGGDAYTLTTPWPIAEVYNLVVCPSVDDLIIYHPTIATQVLARNAIGGGTEDWSIGAFNFVDGPYLAKDTSGTRMTVTNPTLILKLTSAAAFGSPSVGSYLEYQKNNQWYLGIVLGTGSTPAAPANPTSSTVYIQPVPSIVRNVDQSAVIAFNTISAGVYEVRSTVRVFNYSLIGSYLRYLDKNNSNTPSWSYVSGYNGLINYPTSTITNPTTRSQLTTGHTYQITAYTSGYIVPVDGSAYQCKNLGESFTIGTGYTLSSPVMTLSDLSTLQQFDCVATNATAILPASITASVTETLYTNTATVTASAATFNSSRDVGRFIRIKLGSGTSTTVISMKITAVASSTSCTVTPLTTIPYAVNSPNLLDNGVATIWNFGAFYTSNYPGCGMIYERRHIVAGSPSDPETAFFSESDEFNSFAPSDSTGAVQDTSAFAANVPSTSLTRIRWIAAAINLIIGTESNENQVRPSYVVQTLTPNTFRVSPDSTYGSLMRPIRVGGSLVFVQRSGLALKQLQFDQTVDGFQGDDIQLIAEHIFRSHGGVKDFGYQQYPNSILWFAMNDGALCGLTYNKKEEVFAFHQHSLGFDPISGTSALVETLCVSPGQSGAVDELYLGVNRNGSRRVEKLSPDFNPSSATDKSKMVFLDNYTYQAAGGTPITSVSGLSRFNGQSVGMLIDGTSYAPQVVTSGALTLPKATSATGQVYIGYRYSGIIQTLPIAKEIPGGTTFGKVSQIGGLLPRLINSMEFKVGQDLNSLQQFEFRQMNTPLDSSTPLFTGVPTKVMPVAFDNQRDPTYYVVSDDPYPMNILTLTPSLTVL